ncbi:MAG TPA: hypothetical protein VGM37_21315 [Armatimonadota bacterium]|jgi:hypothetical protein
MTIGDGNHRYEWTERWARLPEGVTLGYTHGVAPDAHDNVYVFNQSKDAVCVFDPDGCFVKSWGGQFAEGAHGLYLSREPEGEFLYLTDYELHAVFKTTLDGEVLWKLTAPPLREAYPTPVAFNPTDTCVAPNGDLYVFDGYGQSWVHQYSPTAEYIRSFDGADGPYGRFQCPHGGWVDTRGETPALWVADRGNNRIQILTLDGHVTGVITDDLRFPCCFYQMGAEMLVPDLQARLTILGPNNRVAAHLGDTPGIWDEPGWPNLPSEKRPLGHFSSPHAACADSRGNIFVVEWVAEGRIVRLEPA